MNQSYSNFVNSLKDRLSTMPNNSLYIMINNSFFKDKNKLILARYNTDTGKGHLQLGYFISVEGKRAFKDDPKLIELLYSAAYNCKLFGIDFSEDIPAESNTPIVAIHGALRVLEIKTQIYHLLFENVYMPDKDNQDRNISFPLTGRVLTQSEKLHIKTSFDDYMFEAYLGAMNDRFYEVIMSQRNGTLLFYRQLNSFVPLFVTGPCLFNPLIQHPQYSEFIKGTRLYKIASLIEKEYNGLVIKFITHKEICKSLGLPRFTRMPFRFITQILFGLFKPQYPNKNTYTYVRTSSDETLPAELTERDYNELSVEYKGDYRRFNTLYIHCYRYRTNVGAPNEVELYRLIEQSKWVM